MHNSLLLFRCNTERSTLHPQKSLTLSMHFCPLHILQKCLWVHSVVFNRMQHAALTCVP
jgi:hypothetical protein